MPEFRAQARHVAPEAPGWEHGGAEPDRANVAPLLAGFGEGRGRVASDGMTVTASLSDVTVRSRHLAIMLLTYSCRQAEPRRVRSPRSFSAVAISRRLRCRQRRSRIVASTSCSA